MPSLVGRTRSGVIGSKAGAVNAYGYLRGGPALAAALTRLQKGMSDELLKRATLAGAQVLEQAWKERVPVDEANYRNGIKARSRKGKKGATGIVAVEDVPGVGQSEQPRLYASRLEFGSARATSRTLRAGIATFSSRSRKEQPSLRPAFDASAGKMLDAMSDELRRLIEAAT